MEKAMTKVEKAKIVRQMRTEGRSYDSIARHLGCNKTECYVLMRYDVRTLVPMKCRYCGAAWVELKLPENMAVFHRCSECATVVWAKEIAAKALAERILADQAATL
jgi:transposase-like protein